MHEISIVQSLLARVDAEAQRHGARAVARIRLRVGEASGVEPSLLRSAFELCRDGGVAATAELELVAEPVAWRCSRCEQPIEAGTRLTCASCGAPARLVAGDALLLERLEMDVEDG